MIIGGIHGNESGAYKAADLLVDCKIKKGELIIVPRSNFVSILANKRGYNGDMNRKFKYISKKDPDYYNVEGLKTLIAEFKPHLVISLHDGYGFHKYNKNHWGQAIVIDENRFKNFELYKIASIVSQQSNKKIKNKRWKIPVFNTKTFSSSLHKEQRNALTGWCLKKDIMAFCLESSKQLPSLKDKITTHLFMIEEFFHLFNIEIEPSIHYLIANLDKFLKSKNYYIEALINSQKARINNSSVIKIKKGDDFKVISFGGKRGVFLVPVGVNLNWNKFYTSKSLSFKLKDDYKTIFTFDLKIV